MWAVSVSCVLYYSRNVIVIIGDICSMMLLSILGICFSECQYIA